MARFRVECHFKKLCRWLTDLIKPEYCARNVYTVQTWEHSSAMCCQRHWSKVAMLAATTSDIKNSSFMRMEKKEKWPHKKRFARSTEIKRRFCLVFKSQTNFLLVGSWDVFTKKNKSWSSLFLCHHLLVTLRAYQAADLTMCVSENVLWVSVCFCVLMIKMFLCLFGVSASDWNSVLGRRSYRHRAAAHQPPEVPQLHPEEPRGGPSQRRPGEFAPLEWTLRATIVITAVMKKKNPKSVPCLHLSQIDSNTCCNQTEQHIQYLSARMLILRKLINNAAENVKNSGA